MDISRHGNLRGLAARNHVVHLAQPSAVRETPGAVRSTTVDSKAAEGAKAEWRSWKVVEICQFCKGEVASA